MRQKISPQRRKERRVYAPPAGGRKAKALRALCVSAVLLLCSGAYGAEVTLNWDANTEPDLDHYTIYQADMGPTRAGDWEKVCDVPAGTTTYATTVPDGVRRVFYCTAVDTAGNESGPSNICYQEEDTTPPSAPKGAQAAIR